MEREKYANSKDPQTSRRSEAIRKGRSERCWRLNTVECKHITRWRKAEVAYPLELTVRANRRRESFVHDSPHHVLRASCGNVTVDCTASAAAVGERRRKELAALDSGEKYPCLCNREIQGIAAGMSYPYVKASFDRKFILESFRI